MVVQRTNSSRDRWTPKMLPAIPESLWRKSSQWVELTRPHAMRIVEDAVVDAVIKKHCTIGYDRKLKRCGDQVATGRMQGSLHAWMACWVQQGSYMPRQIINARLPVGKEAVTGWRPKFGFFLLFFPASSHQGTGLLRLRCNPLTAATGCLLCFLRTRKLA